MTSHGGEWPGASGPRHQGSAGHPEPGGYVGMPGGPESWTMPTGPGGATPAAASTGVRVHAQGSGWYSTALAPLMTINQGQITTPALAMGSVDVPLPPGRHHIAIECRSWKTYGLAMMTVDVQPGRMTDVYYAAPANVFSNGRIGLTPQRRVGGGLLLAILLIPLVLILLTIIVPMLLAIGLG